MILFKGLQATYKITDAIYPFFLEADFNGDTKVDISVTREGQVSNKSSFVIFQ